MKHLLLIAIALFILFPSCLCEGKDDVTANTKAGVVKTHYRGLHGYIGYRADRPSDKATYGYGMGFYSAVWPLIDKPIARFQIGLAGSWISPDNSDNKDKPLAPIGTHARDNWPRRAPTPRTSTSSWPSAISQPATWKQRSANCNRPWP